MVTSTSSPIMSAVEDAEQRAVSMDRETFRGFYEKTAGALRAYLSHLTRNEAIADDLLQESYCRLLAARLHILDESRMRSYLFTVATNLARDRWRRKDTNATNEIPDLASHPPDPTLRLDMRAALGSLKLRDRQIVWLAYVEGWNHNEIARAVGLKSASIRLLLFRARRKLANRLHGGHELPVEESK